MTDDDIGWHEILPEPFVVCVLGARGEGKTALSHHLVEVFEDDDRDAYIMGFPEDKTHLLPADMEVLPATTARGEWPEDSIVLIHEAHQLLHARRSMDAENLELDKLVTVSRHKNSDIVYETQQSHRLDKNAVASVDALLVRWPALMQEQFERRAVRDIIAEAREALSDYVTVHDEDDYEYVERRADEDGTDMLKKHVYVHADRFRGEYPDEVPLPDHWSDGISKAYGSPAPDEDDGSGPDDATTEDNRLAAKLNDARYREILSKALERQLPADDDWKAMEVNAAGGHISSLLADGIIEREYESNNIKTFKVKRPLTVKEHLSEYD